MIQNAPKTDAGKRLVIYRRESLIMIIPKKEAQPIKYKMYEEYTPTENKLELLDGVFLPFNNEREKMLLLCLYNIGLQEFIKILPQESKIELLRLLQQDLKE